MPSFQPKRGSAERRAAAPRRGGRRRGWLLSPSRSMILAAGDIHMRQGQIHRVLSPREAPDRPHVRKPPT
jgi:hypothetical protein